MTQANVSRVLFWAAVFNWLIGLGLMFAPNLLLGLISVTPAVANPTWPLQFGWLVFVFGIGYHWASRDLQRNQQIIRLAIPGKIGVAAVAMASVAAGHISWQIMIPAGADAIWAVLFVFCLRSFSREQSRVII
jgi:hypothetical protein